MTEGFPGSPGQSAPTSAAAPSRPSTSPWFTLPSLGDSQGRTAARPCRAAHLRALCRPRTRVGFRVVCLLPGLQAFSTIPSSGVNVAVCVCVLRTQSSGFWDHGNTCHPRVCVAWLQPRGSLEASAPPLRQPPPRSPSRRVCCDTAILRPAHGASWPPTAAEGTGRAGRAGCPSGTRPVPHTEPTPRRCSEPDGARLCAHCSPIRPLPRDTGPVGPRSTWACPL